MCGIVGAVGRLKNCKITISRMTDTLSHRGPDGRGDWVSEADGLVMGHTRLAILDLSDAGRQPMESKCGRYVITFNGEIYNHQRLRADLDRSARKIPWAGSSDTETLLEAISSYGVEDALSKADGMFAFALWDKKEKELTLSRDRMGEKPLYYGVINDVFYFASEVTAIENAVDRLQTCEVSVSFLLKYGYIPHPLSIFDNVWKLEPATILSVKTAAGGLVTSKRRYWDPKLQLEGAHTIAKGAITDVEQELDRLLSASVRDRMLADVGVGCLLSGGIDSTYVTALMQKHSSRPIKTYTIGFHDPKYNEAQHAKSVAEYIGTEHTELYLSEDDVLSAVPNIASRYDEPFADSSQLPTYLVCKLASSSIKVVLTGDGGDELFYGYKRYELGAKAWRMSRKVPRWLRSGIGAGLETYLGDNGEVHWAKALPSAVQITGRRKSKLTKISRLLKATDFRDFYDVLVSNHTDLASFLVGAMPAEEPKFSVPSFSSELSISDQMMLLDIYTYLPGDILCKVDRASMANSLESRAPLLGREVVDFAMRLPLGLKQKGGVQKWLLKKCLERHVPKEITNRPKKGFSIPLDQWLSGPLREWAGDLLNSSSLQTDTMVNIPAAKALLDNLSGESDGLSAKLWPILMYAGWKDLRRTI